MQSRVMHRPPADRNKMNDQVVKVKRSKAGKPAWVRYSLAIAFGLWAAIGVVFIAMLYLAAVNIVIEVTQGREDFVVQIILPILTAWGIVTFAVGGFLITRLGYRWKQ